MGLEYRNEEGEIKGTFSETTDTFSVFAQDELRLFDALFLTGGVRYDHNSAFGDATTGRAALSYVIRASDTRLKASWAEGFRAPTFNELFFPATFPPCPAVREPRPPARARARATTREWSSTSGSDGSGSPPPSSATTSTTSSRPRSSIP